MIDDTNKLQKFRPELVVGFLFLDHCRQVVLIRKDKPDWQAGRLNGVGGKVEPGENFMDAMPREWYEETGESRSQWEHFAQLDIGRVTIHFFRAFDQTSIAKTTEKEVIVRADVSTLRDSEMHCRYGDTMLRLPVVTNLKWLIPLALSGESAIITQ